VDTPQIIRRAGRDDSPLIQRLHDSGVRAWHLQCLSLGSVGLCIGLWIRAKTVDQDERGNAERRALFVGLWPPTIWLIGDSLQRVEQVHSPFRFFDRLVGVFHPG
jgi:hypothetical protein